MGESIAAAPVRKRRVFYVMGFDPRGTAFYHAQLKREARISQKRGFSSLQVGPLEEVWEHGHECQCEGRQDGNNEIRISYQFLSISDFVSEYFALPIPIRIARSLRLFVQEVFSGYFCSGFVNTPKFTLFTLYPFAMLAISPLLGVIVGLLLAVVNYPVSGIAVGLAVATIGTYCLLRYEHRFYIMYLLGDFLFSAQALTKPPPALQERLEKFKTAVSSSLQACQNDEEVLIVGHSSGALLAIQLAAALSRSVSAQDRQHLSLLTLGNQASLAYLRGTDQFRQDVADVIRASGLTWHEIYAPQDVISSGKFDFVTRLNLQRPTLSGYQLRSARLKETLTGRTYRRLKHSFLKLHMRYLRASETGNGFNYFALLESPFPLRDFIF